MSSSASFTSPNPPNNSANQMQHQQQPQSSIQTQRLSTGSQQLQMQPLPPQSSSSHQTTPAPSIQFRVISRNNSNTSTASSSNKGEFSSTLSTTNSVVSSRSHLTRPHTMMDYRQLLATCGATNSTPMRSFQRATFSSVAKTRAFDNNPLLLLSSVSPASNQNSVSDSRNSSPISTPVFSRSRSLRMSAAPHRYQQHLRISTRTPDLYSFSYTGDTSSFNFNNDSQAKIDELSNEKSELKESLEFLECERQVLIDSAKELKETLQKERSQWKKEQDELKRQIADSIAGRVRAESQLTNFDVCMNDSVTQFKKLNEELQAKDKQLETAKKQLDDANSQIKELQALNIELQKMLTEKLKYNGWKSSAHDNEETTASDCMSIVTELARLRLANSNSLREADD